MPEETKEPEQTEKSTTGEADDLSVKRDNQSEFTHAKFLNEEKVAKHFDENIRPIMAKEVSSISKLLKL